MASKQTCNSLKKQYINFKKRCRTGRICSFGVGKTFQRLERLGNRLKDKCGVKDLRKLR